MNNGEKKVQYTFSHVTKEHTPQRGQVRPIAPEVLDSSAQCPELQTRIAELRLKESSSFEPTYEKGVD